MSPKARRGQGRAARVTSQLQLLHSGDNLCFSGLLFEVSSHRQSRERLGDPTEAPQTAAEGKSRETPFRTDSKKHSPRRARGSPGTGLFPIDGLDAATLLGGERV